MSQFKKLDKFQNTRIENKKKIINSFKKDRRWNNQFDFLEVPKKIKPSYMTFALPAISKYYETLVGAMHPIDKTCRPQFLKKSTNPKLHNILKFYEK